MHVNFILCYGGSQATLLLLQVVRYVAVSNVTTTPTPINCEWSSGRRCMDGTCMKNFLDRCSNGCYAMRPRRCGRSCVSYYWFSTTGCPFVRCLFKCPDGACVSTYRTKCSNGCLYNEKKCSVGTSSMCHPKLLPCPMRPVACSDAAVVNATKRCPAIAEATRQASSQSVPGHCRPLKSYFCCIYAAISTCDASLKKRFYNHWDKYIKNVTSEFEDKIMLTCNISLANALRQAETECVGNMWKGGSFKITVTSPKPPACPYRCPDGTCLSSAHVLCPNGCLPSQIKCGDGSCKQYSYLCTCQAWSPYKCDTGRTCYGSTQRCDGKRDCKDGLDEKNCPFIGEQCRHYKCYDGFGCYSESSKCNGVRNCGDGTDESDCDGSGGGTNSGLVSLVALPVVLLVVAFFCYCKYKDFKRCRGTEMNQEPSREPRLTNLSTTTVPLWSAASASYRSPPDRRTTAAHTSSHSGGAAPPPLYQDALHTSRYPPVQPLQQLEEAPPSYVLVSYILPKVPSPMMTHVAVTQSTEPGSGMESVPAVTTPVIDDTLHDQPRMEPQITHSHASPIPTAAPLGLNSTDESPVDEPPLYFSGDDVSWRLPHESASPPVAGDHSVQYGPHPLDSTGAPPLTTMNAPSTDSQFLGDSYV